MFDLLRVLNRIFFLKIKDEVADIVCRKGLKLQTRSIPLPSRRMVSGSRLREESQACDHPVTVSRVVLHTNRAYKAKAYDEDNWEKNHCRLLQRDSLAVKVPGFRLPSIQNIQWRLGNLVAEPFVKMHVTRIYRMFFPKSICVTMKDEVMY